LGLSNSLSCLTTEHRLYRGYAALMVLVYPLGTPTLFLAALASQRRRLNPPDLTVNEALQRRAQDPTLRSTRFLWMSYEPRCWWFESVEALRRLSLTGMLVLCYPDSINQVLIGLGIAFASMRVFTFFAPFVSEWQE
jgi:hypothetical protein